MVIRVEKLEKNSGGGDNGGMDTWQTSVENRLSQLHNDICGLRNFILMLYGAGFIFILGAFAYGYNLLSDDVHAIDIKATSIESKIDLTNNRLNDIEALIKSLKQQPGNPHYP